MSRPNGSKNKKTERWEEFADWFIVSGMPKLKEEMSKLEGKDYIHTMRDLMEYFQPKLARLDSDITSKGEKLDGVQVYLPNQNKDDKTTK